MNDLIIHQRRTKFASDRQDWHRLPVSGSAAFERRNGPRNPLADWAGWAAVAIGTATLTYMLGRIIFAAIMGG